MSSGRPLALSARCSLPAKVCAGYCELLPGLPLHGPSCGLPAVPLAVNDRRQPLAPAEKSGRKAHERYVKMFEAQGQKKVRGANPAGMPSAALVVQQLGSKSCDMRPEICQIGWKWKEMPFTRGTSLCTLRAQAPLVCCVPWLDIRTTRIVFECAVL